MMFLHSELPPLGRDRLNPLLISVGLLYSKMLANVKTSLILTALITLLKSLFLHLFITFFRRLCDFLNLLSLLLKKHQVTQR